MHTQSENLNEVLNFNGSEINQDEDDDISYRMYDDDAWLENTYDFTDQKWRDIDDEVEYVEGILEEESYIRAENKITMSEY